MKRWVCCILLTSLIVSLFTACSGKPSSNSSVLESPDLLAGHYEADFTVLEQNQGIFTATLWGDTAYYLTYYGLRKPALMACDIKTGAQTELTALAESVAEDAEAIYRISAAASGPEGPILFGFKTVTASSGDSRLPFLIYLDAQGQVLRKVEIESGANPRLTYTQGNIAADGEGNIYVRDQLHLFQLTADGKCRTIPAPVGGTIVEPVAWRAGVAAVVRDDKRNYALYPIDPQKCTMGESAGVLPVPDGGNTPDFYPSQGEYDLYCSAGLSLYGYRLGEDTACDQVLNWANCNVDCNNLLCVAEMGEGLLACVTYSELFGGSLATLRRCEEGESEKTTITLACRGQAGDLAAKVILFNRMNPQYQVVLRDYDAYDPTIGLAGGFDRLTAEIISGKVPDLICTQGMDVDAFIRLGMLEDLWPYIDADQKLGGREALVQPLFRALTRDGKLYEAPTAFQVYTVFGVTDLVGETPGWSWEAFWALYDGLEEPFFVQPSWGKELGLDFVLLPFYLEHLLRDDVFHAEEFENLLRLADTFPQNPLRYTEGEVKQMQRDHEVMGIWSGYMNNPDGYMESRAQAAWPSIAVGFPGLPGNGGVFVPVLPIAMTSSSPNKEGAWAFLSFLLSPEGQLTWLGSGHDTKLDFPSSKPVYDELVRRTMREDSVSYGSYSIEYPAVWTQAQANEFWEMLEGVQAVRREAPQLEAILYEEAKRYFDGAQTLEQAVKSAESRVNLYLGERKKG